MLKCVCAKVRVYSITTGVVLTVGHMCWIIVLVRHVATSGMTVRHIMTP
jgi:hypothetical protein